MTDSKQITKVAFNQCFGGFSLSTEGKALLKKLDPSLKEGCDWGYTDHRHNPALIEVIETLGDKAGGPYAKLRIEEITGDKYYIDEYDGFESVETAESIEWTYINGVSDE